MGGQPVDDLLRHERGERLLRRGLLDDGRMEPLELVDQPRAPVAAGHPPEQLRHLPVDRLLRGAELGGHLLVPEAAAHHVEDPAIVLVGVLPAGQPLRDRRIDDAAARVDLADRPHQLVALRDPVLQEVREPPVPAAEQRERVLLVVVRGEHHDAGVGVVVADRVGAVDPLELERRRHLDVGDDHVGDVLTGGDQERRGVLGDPHDLDAVVGLEERAHTLAHQHVVLAQHHPDRHPPWDPPCTMRACCAWSSRRITTSCARGPSPCCRRSATSTSWRPPSRSTSCWARSRRRRRTRC